VKSIRTLLALVASALMAAAFFAASAHACSYAKGEQVFSAYGDPRAYVLVPDGDFAAGGAGWALGGGASVVSGALSLPATAPPLPLAFVSLMPRPRSRSGGSARAHAPA